MAILDIGTMEACENWLRVRKEEAEAKINETLGQPDVFGRLKSETIETLLKEIQSKTADIRKAREENPNSGLEMVEKTKTRKVFRCPTCQTKQQVYRIHFAQTHVKILRKIFAYCVKYRTHDIQKKNIPGLTHTDYGNFAFLQRFGFIYWKTEEGKKLKDGSWGVAVKRIRDFLVGDWPVAEYSEKNTLTGVQTVSEKRVNIRGIKRYKLEQLRKDHQENLPYFVEYKQQEQEEGHIDDIIQHLPFNPSTYEDDRLEK